MSVNRIDLLNHTFSRSLRGYDPEEVDNFLHDVADSLARMSDERVRLMNKIAQLEDRLTAFAQREMTLRETLVASQRMSEDLKDAAQKEAQAVLEAAQSRAESLTNQAHLRLARILDEIADARKIKAQFEFRTRATIESHLKLLEMSQMEDSTLEKMVSALGRRSNAIPEDSDEHET